jgi:hypothetical protein
VVTFLVRDALGSADTVGLAQAPIASGGGMAVSVGGLNGGSVQANDTGFKVTITAQDAPNGTASTLAVSNLVFNSAAGRPGPITISAAITTGAGTEFIEPGRVTDAFVLGSTQSSSTGLPTVEAGRSRQPAAGIVIVESNAGALQTGDMFTLQLREAGVRFSAGPALTVQRGGGGHRQSARLWGRGQRQQHQRHHQPGGRQRPHRPCRLHPLLRRVDAHHQWRRGRSR